VKKNVAIVIVILALLAITARPRSVQATIVNIPTFELYAPAKIVISFSYTKSVVVHVTTLGQSLYKAITSPTSVEFDTESFDVFTVTVNVFYSWQVNQTVTIGFFEGGRAAKGIEVGMNDNVLNLVFKISVVQAPSYPTADQIADAMMQRWQNQLAVFEASQRDLTNTMANTVTTVGSIAVIAFVVCLICIIAVFMLQRRVAELSEWGIRHKAEEGG
jgi:hypothetical protein